MEEIHSMQSTQHVFIWIMGSSLVPIMLCHAYARTVSAAHFKMQIVIYQAQCYQ